MITRRRGSRLKAPLLFFLLTFSALSFGQVRVRFTLHGQVEKSGSYFLAGNLNGWNPADSLFLFKENQLVLQAKPGDFMEYKITRGSWAKVESDSLGLDVANRTLQVNQDTNILLAVSAWKDMFTMPVAKRHTASPNVTILDSNFYIPQLKRYRTIRLYLPPDYHRSRKKYPVLYLNDGQNCFDESTASFGEWQVDEALDHFFDSCGKSLIVVAVDNGPGRLQEYNPYDFEKTGVGEGKQYSSFLAETLKPFIDSAFRTKRNWKNTHIAGSSMGGVISMYTLIAYPDVFGNAGVFSPAFWTSEPIYKAAKGALPFFRDHSVFLYAGGRESNTMVFDTKAMYRVLSGRKRTRVELIIDEMANHNEQAWSKWFQVYLKYILR